MKKNISICLVIGSSFLFLFNFVYAGNLMLNTTSGNVGVGLSSPSYKLDVLGDINFSETLKVDGVTIIDASKNWVGSIISAAKGGTGLASCSANQILKWNGTTSTWNCSNGTGIAVEGTSGGIEFNKNGVLSDDASNLFWDDTNNRLGLGTTTPGSALEVKTAAASDTNLLKIGDNNKSAFLTAGSGYFGIATGDGVNRFSIIQSNGSISLNGKNAFNTADSWLRINDVSGFSSGVYFGTSLVRTDSRLEVGSSGASFYAQNGSAFFNGTIKANGNITAPSFVGNLTGNAATATSATSATNATNANFATNAGYATDAGTADEAIHATNADSATNASWLIPNTALTYGASGLNYFNLNGTAGTTANSNVTPTSAWYHILRMNHGNSAGYFVDIAASLTGAPGNVYWRQVNNGTNYGWYTFLDSNNYNSFAPKKDGTGASGTWGISISGNAATATTATTATSATTATTATSATTATTAVNLSGAGGSSIQRTSTGTAYSNAYQIREASGGSGNTSVNYAPMLGFHWASVVASSIRINSSGDFEFINNPGTGYENVYASAFLYASDRNLKTNIKPLDNSLDKILRLQGVSFEWKDVNSDKGVNIGLIAQDVEKVYPELVSTNTNGIKSVEYGNLVAPLIEAIKEQQKEIEELKKEVENLKNK